MTDTATSKQSPPWGCALQPSKDCYFILSRAELYFSTYLVTCLTGPVFAEGPGSLWSTLKRRHVGQGCMEMCSDVCLCTKDPGKLL